MRRRSSSDQARRLGGTHSRESAGGSGKKRLERDEGRDPQLEKRKERDEAKHGRATQKQAAYTVTDLIEDYVREKLATQERGGETE